MSETAQNLIYGAWQHPVNRWQGLPNSIHTDDVAAKVGMRGGTIPGSVHLGHFRPILDDLFGDVWYHTSAISLYFTFATVDQEAVRAVLQAPPAGATDVLLNAHVEDANGRIVAKGHVAVGHPAGTPYVRAMRMEQSPPGANRILSRMLPGTELPVQPAFTITEGGEDGVVRDPSEMFRALRGVAPELLNQPVVGFFGASEVSLHAGPIRTHTPYRKTGTVLCTGESGKTEFAWFEFGLYDQDGTLIASMRHLNRWMKVSSPLWKAA